MLIKKLKFLFIGSLWLTCSLLTGCKTEDHFELNPPGDDWIHYTEFQLKNIDSSRYWGDSEKIRLQSGVIMLNPDNRTYLKKFLGTSIEAWDPAEVKWSKEESGQYKFSTDSTYILFSHDPDTVFYFKAYWNIGIYHPVYLEQHDSVWYRNSSFSMGVSGKFVYSGKAGKE